MGRLLLLFILVPLAEFALLIQIGRYVGLVPTLALIVATGALGAFLARRQGLSVLARLRSELDQGRLPANQMVDGIIILLAGAVLMTPGILTDVFGFFCLVPAGREWIKRRLKSRLGVIQKGDLDVTVGGAGPGGRGRPVRDVTPPAEQPSASLDD